MQKFETIATSFSALQLFMWLNSVPRSMRKITYFRTQRHRDPVLTKITMADLNKIIPGLGKNQAMLSLGASNISEDIHNFSENRQHILTASKSTRQEVLSVVDDISGSTTAFERFTTLEDLHKTLSCIGEFRLGNMIVGGINIDLDNKNVVFMSHYALMFNVSYCGLEASIDVSKQLGWM